MTLAEARQLLIDNLTPKYGSGEAISLARIVFEDVFFPLGIKEIAGEAQTQFNHIQTRLLQDEPLQYILGKADFFGLKLEVNPSVLIPRQETEELVALIIEQVSKSFKGDILDIGTGSGCIPIALKKYLPYTKMSACDISQEALDIAKKNAQEHHLEVSFFQTNILNRSQWQEVSNYDLIVSNPPYIPTQEAHLMPERVKNFEPSLALFVENEDPLIFYRHIAQFAKQHLNLGGLLFFELNEYNAPQVAELLRTEDFKKIQIHLDLNGKQRMSSAAL